MIIIIIVIVIVIVIIKRLGAFDVVSLEPRGVLLCVSLAHPDARVTHGGRHVHQLSSWRF
eukprot:3609438-Karenia_brevis.AAC.1